MLTILARGTIGGAIRPCLLCHSRQALLHSPARRSISSSAPIPSSSISKRATTFWSTDEPLLRALRRRQESYRLAEISSSARKKSERLDAIQLAKSELRWAVQHVRKLRNTSSKSPLDRDSRRKLISMVMRMTRRNVPLSYLLGSVPFGSLGTELTVRPPTLLPRPETEDWASEVVKVLLESDQLEQVRVVDLCTGSGCIALLIADALRARLGEGGRWRVVACDRSPAAVELAQENAQKLGFTINDRESNLHILPADVFSDQDMDGLANVAGGPFDLVVSNPPYIPRREWDALSKEVKEHEDPSALIGERNPPAGESDTRQAYLDRQGLAFHQRLAELLYRPTFSASRPALPRLVAEYGKGQQKQVERLHADLKAPKDRLPKVIHMGGHLVVVGVGNATTHPMTRHSIGQVVLNPLLRGLLEQDRRVRDRLKASRDDLEAKRREAVAGESVDSAQRPDWLEPVPTKIPIYASPARDGSTQHVAELDLNGTNSATSPTELTKSKSGGWSTTLDLLVPASPSFFSTRPLDATVYIIQVSLYKPSQAMNLSGVGLKAFLASQSHHNSASRGNTQAGSSSNVATGNNGWNTDDVLVLQDELDLDFGQVKRKDVGSARGHNGVRDIIARLDIPSSEAAAATNSASSKRASASKADRAGAGEAGPKLSRLRIGIGRPETTLPAGRKESWLPAALQPKQPKAMRVDRWVLSPLTPGELESCQTANGGNGVLDQVQTQTLQWLAERCAALAHANQTERKAKISSRKDQFGVFRTVWIE